MLRNRLSEKHFMKLVNKLHNISLQVLTLCGFGALVCLAVNLMTALAMLFADHCKKA